MPLMACAPPSRQFSRSNDEQEALIVAARLPAAIGTLLALRAGRTPSAYPDTRRYGVRYLQLMHERIPSEKAMRIFEQLQILQIDHSFNASTFTARVVTSIVWSIRARRSSDRWPRKLPQRLRNNGCCRL